MKGSKQLNSICRSKKYVFFPWPKCPWPKSPLAEMSVAEMSVAEMSWPKRPWPKCPWPKYPSNEHCMRRPVLEFFNRPNIYVNVSQLPLAKWEHCMKMQIKILTNI